MAVAHGVLVTDLDDLDRAEAGARVLRDPHAQPALAHPLGRPELGVELARAAGLERTGDGLERDLAHLAAAGAGRGRLVVDEQLRAFRAAAQQDAGERGAATSADGLAEALLAFHVAPRDVVWRVHVMKSRNGRAVMQ